MFKPLPEDDDELVLRSESRKYGLPSPSTLAKYASRPAESPVDLPYTLAGRCVAYRAGDLRKLRKALTFRHSADRLAAGCLRRARQGSR